MKFLLATLFTAALLAAAGNDGDWPVYGHDSGGTKYSPLDQINRQNVARLQVAWTFHTGDMYDPKGRAGKKSAFESTPLFIDGALYVTTPFGRLIALDPATGAQKWAFDPKSDIAASFGDFVNRGAATWVDARSKQRRLP
jgi:quinoprotein glucose dehydrogenase